MRADKNLPGTVGILTVPEWKRDTVTKMKQILHRLPVILSQNIWPNHPSELCCVPVKDIKDRAQNPSLNYLLCVDNKSEKLQTHREGKYIYSK